MSRDNEHARKSPGFVGGDDEILDVLLRDVFDTPRNLSRLGELIGGDGDVELRTLGNITLNPVEADFQSAQRRRIEELEGDLLGSRVGGYEIIERIGKGGMGLVFRARQESPLFTREVAMKFPIPREETATADREKFVEEAKGLASLSHPNLVPIFDSGTEGDLIFFTMELVDGKQLDEWAHTSKPSIEERVRLVRDVARALSYLHENHVVHRDIKPANVLVDVEGRAKLVDFGIAQFSIDARKRAIEAGTPFYVAPEIVDPRAGFGEIGPGADVYALGAVLYFLLYDREVFADETDLDGVLRATLESPVRLPRRSKREVPRELESIVRRALQKRVQDRFWSVSKMAEELDRFLRRRRSRNARRLAMGSVAVILLLALLVASFSSSPVDPGLSLSERNEILAPYRDELDALGQSVEDVRLVIDDDRTSGRFGKGILDGVVSELAADFQKTRETFDEMTEAQSRERLGVLGDRFEKQRLRFLRELLGRAHRHADAAREPLIQPDRGGAKGPRTLALLREGLEEDEKAREEGVADPAGAIQSFIQARDLFLRAEVAWKAYTEQLGVLRRRRSNLEERLTRAQVALETRRDHSGPFLTNEASAQIRLAAAKLGEAREVIDKVVLDSESPGSDLDRLDEAEVKIESAEKRLESAGERVREAVMQFERRRQAARERLKAFRTKQLEPRKDELSVSFRERIKELDEELETLAGQSLVEPADVFALESALGKLQFAFEELLDEAATLREKARAALHATRTELEEVTSSIPAERLPRALAPLHDSALELRDQGVKALQAYDYEGGTRVLTRSREKIHELARRIEAFGLGERMVWIPPRGPGDTIPGFWLDRYETTIAEWLAFLRAASQEDHEHCCGKSKPRRSHEPIGWAEQLRRRDRSLPVIGVRPEDALAYARHQHKELPDDELWLRATARPARQSSEDATSLGGIGSGAVNGAGSEDGHDRLAPVALQLGMSPYGAHHMAGNAPEWIVVDGQPAALAGGSFETPDPHYLRADRIVLVPEDSSRESFVRLAGLRLLLRGRVDP